MKSKLISKNQAVGLIKNGDTVAVGGFVGCAHPEDITAEIEKVYLKNKTPKNLTLVFAAGQGDNSTKGLNHFGHEGLIKKVIGGHWSLTPKLQKLAVENKIEAYNLPQGVISQLYRDIAAKRPGTITHVGLKTFIDPEIEGGKLNDITKNDIVESINMNHKKYLFYRSFPIDVVILRATYADEYGNTTMEKEAATLDATAMAQAAKNSGGIVIVQVEDIVSKGSLDPKKVKIPGIYVDAVVIGNRDNHMQTFGEYYNPSYSGETRSPIGSEKSMPLNERKVIARRSAMELIPNSIINLGIGMPEGVAKVAEEEGVSDEITLTIESGGIGGIPSSGLSFGASMNPESILDQSSQFDFYDGGGLDMAFLGLAQCDKFGNINVSKFGTKIAGCGGFIDISQNAKKVVYCGTFTGGGLKTSIEDNKLKILQEGKFNKFVDSVQQITFSSEYSKSINQQVIYITERAVFELKNSMLILKEFAPGIDIEKDILQHMDFKPIISNDLKVMDCRIFMEKPMGIKNKAIA